MNASCLLVNSPDLDIAFSSASQAAELIRGAGLAWEIVQLTPGFLQGRFSFKKRKRIAIMSLECDR